MTEAIQVEKIDRFFAGTLDTHGVAKNAADAVRNALVNASLLGIDSHGVNLFEHYIQCVIEGRVNKETNISFSNDGGFITCDANHNFSHYAALELLKVMDDATSSQAISIGRIVNSDHIGAVGIHAFNSKIQNKLIFGFTNADALANTPDGKSVVFGTNPISCVMNERDQLLYIDLATTKYSMNKIKNYRRSKTRLPIKIARDENMELTTDADAARTIEPIGGHKGFALAFLVEVMTSGLSGQAHSADLLSMYYTDLTVRRNVSHSFIMVNPEFLGLGGVENIWKVVQATRDRLETDQEKLSPGRKELQTRRARMVDGIPVQPEILSGWSKMGF
ncbi:Ldh family oxidoreductase [Alphaproteobacteria bacterium]|nr:Ldh family oxidoreductase [Alphaproteobacteria bacterium]MDA9581445.1 Ldh family oxidoreductase [bacterium]MDA8625807.1 Ldh family oxidoreductase [Alphaproteobacteria bacterium]MDA8642653.1 Ldh family oxidoreductase [Alphaproteobacteria bacterium]MDA8666451.1 Ldh family oxidoreductase [Alphaproteobacteria bacterium]